MVSFIRRGESEGELIVAAANFTPVVRVGYRIGLPRGGFWREALNSDAEIYGGSGCGNMGEVRAEKVPFHGRDYSAEMTLPPLGFLIFVSGEAETISEQEEK